MAPSEAGLVRRTIWLLRAVAAHPEGVGLSEVAREAGIPKATCYRVLTVLERESWLTLDPITRRYRVSLGLVQGPKHEVPHGRVYERFLNICEGPNLPCTALDLRGPVRRH